MRIAVCEDNAKDRTLLCDYIRDYMIRHSYSVEIFTFSDGEALLEAFPSGVFDLLLLDIFLPGISGIDTARKIRETDQYCKLMFITVSADYMPESFSVQTSGYVVKPITPENMDGAMTILYDMLEKNSRVIEVPVGREGTVNLSLAQIEYAESFDKSIVFYMHDRRVETHLKLSDVESMLGGEPFLRCHRSYIINMNHIKDISGDCFLMKNGRAVPIPARNRKEMRLAVTGYLAGRPLRELRKGLTV